MTQLYLLDTNVFIEAKNRHYGFDFCPGFWEWLAISNQNSRVASIKKVSDELLHGDDDLSEWASQQSGHFFIEHDATVITALTHVASWATNHGYAQNAIATFLGCADCWIVAHALAHGFHVVTHETFAAAAKRIKIPNACSALGVSCMTPYEMLRREQARFVLGTN